jgi:hypothetical protein
VGTNYYAVKGKWLPEVSDWGHPLYGLIREGTGRPASIHIGKSSGGWCFSLHVMPQHGISNLGDWKVLVDRLIAGGWRIEDEYREIIALDELWKIVGRVDWERQDGRPLKRHMVDETHCIGHGEGLYDYIIGEFS